MFSNDHCVGVFLSLCLQITPLGDAILRLLCVTSLVMSPRDEEIRFCKKKYLLSYEQEHLNENLFYYII